ncbi:hypothetical protein GF377_01475 [candidate division GN15 bacterium]|nr:hypothetical protein [candidate division GN15 bacterium]
MTFDRDTYKISGSSRVPTVSIGIGIVGLALSVAAYAIDSHRFFHAWLTAFMFWVTMGLGGLFFTMLHHLTNSKWSVVVRRISENLMIQLPWMLVAFIPLLFGLHDLYHWTHADAVAHDELLQQKAPYLNATFFTIRGVVYFGLWSLIAIVLYRLSLKHDTTGDHDLIPKMRKYSAIGMLVFAPTITFAAFDWLMSMDPHWYSTIFGVYTFGGTFFGTLGLLVVILLCLRRKGVLKDIVTVEHYHDLGKLMFGFTVFWSYIAFSQYFLIWYGNIPEETVWYLHRWHGNWKVLSLILLFGHFMLPFVVLIFRNTKRNLYMMGFFAIWFLLMHWIDMYWLVYPTLMDEGFSISWMEAGTVAGLGGVFVWMFWRRLTAHALVPVNDPNLQKSINFVNH